MFIHSSRLIKYKRRKKNRQYWTRKMLSDCDHEPWLLLFLSFFTSCLFTLYIISLCDIVEWRLREQKKFKKIIQKKFLLRNLLLKSFMVSAAHNKVFFSRFFFSLFSYYQKRQHIKFFFSYFTFMLHEKSTFLPKNTHTEKKIENNIKLCNFIMLNFHPTFPYLMVFLFSTLYLLISILSEGFFIFLVKIILILTFKMGNKITKWNEILYFFLACEMRAKISHFKWNLLDNF